jgi:alpha-amylase
MTKSVCLYFKVHQPFSLKLYTQNNVGINHCYEDAAMDEMMINKLADECYLPANKIILSNIQKTNGSFRVSYSISGTALELMIKYRPDVITSFQELVNTGSVEILAETYYHSLSFLHSKKEFNRQLSKHANLVNELFGVTPSVFRNTELIYNNNLAKHINDLGYKGIFCEGSEKILRQRTSNKLYAAPDTGDFTLLLRNATLSDDIAFRFDDTQWNEHPLTAEKFAEWLHAHPEDSEVINLFMDYETFGIYKKEDSGIFDFLDALPLAVLANEEFRFNTPSNIINEYYPRDIYNVPETISWEDHSAACCFWSENARQNNTLKKIYGLENIVMQSEDEKLRETWGKLQAADYIYYMADSNSQKTKYINPFNTPQEMYDCYTSIVTDMEITLITEQLQKHNMHFINQTYNVF